MAALLFRAHKAAYTRALRALNVFRPGSAGLSARIYMPQR